MSYIRTRCPNGCKYKSGDACVASECPYQTGNVRYDIRLKAEDKPTKINAQAKQAIKEFAEKLKKYSYTDNCFTDGKWHRYVFVDDIDVLLEKYEND